jgi:hypothetical protein
MARSRNIKPSIMDNEELAELEPLARLLFIYLWMLADREGRLEDRPKRIAAQALPYDRTADVGAMLDDLQSAGFIVRYEAHGVACIQILAFQKHQAPHVREAASALPAKNMVGAEHNLGSDEDSPWRETGDAEHLPNTQKTASNLEHDLGSAEALPRSPECGFLIPDSGMRNEDVQAQAPATPPARNSKKQKSTPIPESFAVSERVSAWAAVKGYDRLDEHLAAFTRKAKAKGYTYQSWDDAFMEAIREDWAKLRTPGRGQQNTNRYAGAAAAIFEDATHV